MSNNQVDPKVGYSLSSLIRWCVIIITGENCEVSYSTLILKTRVCHYFVTTASHELIANPAAVSAGVLSVFMKDV